MIEPRHVSFADHEGFAFANGIIREGVQNQNEDDGDVSAEPETLQRQDGVLDQAGSLRMRVHNIPVSPWPQTLTSELEFKDPSGEMQSVTKRMAVWPARLLPGIEG